MSYAVWTEPVHNRDAGYGVPAICDRVGCSAPIDRGLSHFCGTEPGAEDGRCQLFFCADHKAHACIHLDRKGDLDTSIATPTYDTDEWIQHKLRHPSWRPWRAEHEWAA